MDVSMHNHAVCIAVTYVTKKKTISLEKKNNIYFRTFTCVLIKL